MTSPTGVRADQSAYAQADTQVRAAVREFAHQAALVGVDTNLPAQNLESARLLLHRLVDEAVDDEARNWPSPQRLIARTPAYVELAQERAA